MSGFTLDVNVRFPQLEVVASVLSVQLEQLQVAINQLKELIIMNQQELAQGLDTIRAQVEKIGTESALTLDKVAALEAALGNAGGVSPEVQAAFDALKAQVQVVDDLIPDPPAA